MQHSFYSAKIQPTMRKTYPDLADTHGCINVIKPIQSELETFFSIGRKANSAMFTKLMPFLCHMFVISWENVG